MARTEKRVIKCIVCSRRVAEVADDPTRILMTVRLDERSDEERELAGVGDRAYKGQGPYFGLIKFSREHDAWRVSCRCSPKAWEITREELEQSPHSTLVLGYNIGRAIGS